VLAVARIKMDGAKTMLHIMLGECGQNHSYDVCVADDKHFCNSVFGKWGATTHDDFVLAVLFKY
jgi:hypothetical protein